MQEVEHTPFISMIITVYNTERYIRKAMDSALAQTFRDFELLLIDDCSPDGSGAICDEYAQKDPERVKVIHLEKNGGASNARNVGLDHVSGKYVCFLDSDDTIDSDLFERAASVLREFHVNTVIYGISEEYYDADGALKYIQPVMPAENKLLADRTELRKEMIHIEEQTLYGYACNKMYLVEHIRNIGIRFPNFKLHEDTIFNIQYFMEEESTYLIAFAPYHYGKRIENSVTSQFVPEYYELLSRKMQMLYDQHVYWDLCTPAVKRIIGNLYVRYTLSALQRNCDRRAHMCHRQRKEWLQVQYASTLYKTLIDFAAPENKLLGIFASLFRKKSVGMALMCARTVYIIKNKMPIVFAKLKQKN